MLAILVWALSSIALTVVIGLLFGTGMRNNSDDAAQVEYLSQWSDMRRLRK